MNGNRPSTDPSWVDADDAPDTSEEPWRPALLAAPVRRGRPVSKTRKLATTLRLDVEVLQHFRANGAGWQSRMNAALKEWIAERGRAGG
jgi:uncharacterized protein (DUF4415 family)